jgi:hypothetical protein
MRDDSMAIFAVTGLKRVAQRMRGGHASTARHAELPRFSCPCLAPACRRFHILFSRKILDGDPKSAA